MIKRTIFCDLCTDTFKTEKTEGSGFSGWGQLNGIVLNEKENPHVCPECLSTLANKADEIYEENN